jgi:translation initiation factor 4A
MDDNNQTEQTCIKNWDELDIPPELLRGIYAYGFEQPSPIQSQAINPVLTGKDVVAQAQSGTGKTGAFSVASIALTDTKSNDTQVLILSPTRELSQQTNDVIKALGIMYKKNPLKTHLFIGGTSTDNDINVLKNDTPHIAVGCPGRVHDMMKRMYLKVNKLRLIILDEADEMLSSGFKEQVYNIFQFLPKDTQLCLFSATMPFELNILTEKFMRNPVKILIKAEQLTLEGIQQYYIALDDDSDKYATLKDLFGMISVSQCLIYCNSVKRVSDLYDAMEQDGFPVCCVHSNMEKEERTNSYEEFKNGKYRVCIATNVMARGIDIQQISVVINFDVPKCIHTYLHRIGRSGRWGRKGTGINFITKRDIKKMKEIEAHYHTEIKELPDTFNNQI